MQHIQMVIVRAKIEIKKRKKEHVKVIIFGALKIIYLGQ